VFFEKIVIFCPPGRGGLLKGRGRYIAQEWEGRGPPER
jgi:hypothetical protein